MAYRLTKLLAVCLDARNQHSKGKYPDKAEP
jgi:hypothetical protein